MRIYINGYEANIQQRVGSNVYAFELLHSLYTLTSSDDVVVILPTSPLADLPKPRKGWRYLVLNQGKLPWSLFALPLWLRGLPDSVKKNSVVLSLGQYAPIFPSMPSIVCVMDLAYYRFPSHFTLTDYWKLRLFTSFSIRQAARVITISESTKNDVVSHFPDKVGKIQVSYLGLPSAATLPTTSSAKRTLSGPSPKKLKPYILYIGTIQPRKNLVRVVQAFEIAHQQNNQLNLVIIGKIGWKAENLLEVISNSPTKNQIHLLGYLDESKKNEYLVQADALILAGLFEGFGIPPLEALDKGVIPIVSNNSSLPEVVGESGILVDPYDEKEIASGMIQAVGLSKQERLRRVQAFKKHRTRFTWEYASKIVYSSILEVIKEDM